MRLDNNFASFYSFIDNIFDSDTWIWYGKVGRGITFNDGIYKGDFKIQSVNANDYLTIINH